MFARITPIVRNLLIINIAALLIGQFARIDLANLLGLRYILADTFAPYQFFTYMFVHGGGWHLFSNMFALFIFGPLLEQLWGPKRFLTFYIVTGVGAGILYSGINYFETRRVEKAAEVYIENPDPERFNSFILKHADYTFKRLAHFIDSYAEDPDNPGRIAESREIVRQLAYNKANIPMVGASGAIFGILMAFGLLFPNTTLMLLFPPIPIKAKYFVGFYGLFELYAGINRAPGDNVAHFAHLAGMLVAWLLIKYWQKKGFRY
jgi:membrane associated rhomboid family serine protease